MFKNQNYHPDKFMKSNPSTNVLEIKKQKKKNKQTKRQKQETALPDSWQPHFNFDALFAITLSNSRLNFYI